jgi:hypothetical protein
MQSNVIQKILLTVTDQKLQLKIVFAKDCPINLDMNLLLYVCKRLLMIKDLVKILLRNKRFVKDSVFVTDCQQSFGG